MKNIRRRLEKRMDDYSIKKKFYYLYILCILLPLVITDSIIVGIVIHSGRVSHYREMENAAHAVQYSISNVVEQAAEFSRKVYMNKYVNSFLEQEYKNSYDYVTSYYDFFKGARYEDTIGSNFLKVTIYADNETMINGGEFARISRDADSGWYQCFKQSGLSQRLFFDYDDSKKRAAEPKRRLMFIKKLDFFDKKREKLLLVELDYSGMNRYLKKMNYSMDIFICQDEKIVLSNGKYFSIAEDFSEFKEQKRAGCHTQMDIYGTKLDIYVINAGGLILKEIKRNLPLMLLLVVSNAVFPILMMQFLNQSFTARLEILSDTFVDMDHEEELVQIKGIQGKDEIGDLMRSYNKMARRINTLIQIVYKDKIKEQEIVMERQRAQLLALQSQINPHFLFNTLESIRMHSVIKKEEETADMIQKLAVLQRQYVDWGEDFVDVEQEAAFVKAYLDIQRYRFGSRLSYEVDVEQACCGMKIPKLTVIPFVENACVHGIESKTASGWIFVRIYIQKECLYIEIEDTGRGMEKEAMERLLWKMRNASIDLLQEKERVGMINACLRLKMAAGNEAEFELEGEEGLGLIVQIKIPFKFLRGGV